MRWKAVMLVGGLLIAQAGAALAQYSEPSGKLEILPFAGYRWGGGLSTVTGFRSIDTQDNWAYGVGLGMTTPKNSGVELAWTHFQGDVTGVTNGGLTVKGRSPLKRDDIMLNGLWYAYRPTKQTKPYFTAGLGAAIFSADGLSTIGRFSWMLGIGIHRDINEKAALRISGKWTPVWITTGSGVWCDPFYCYSVGTGENFDQWEAGLTLVLKP